MSDQKKKLRAFRRENLIRGIVSLGISLAFLAFVAYQMRLNQSFELTRILLVTLPLVILWFSLESRAKRCFHEWTTAELIQVMEIARMSEKVTFSTELCDRAISKDHMAKAFLYGKPWEDKKGGRGEGLRRGTLDVLKLPPKNEERVIVYDLLHGFKTARGRSRRTAFSVTYWIFGIVLVGALIQDAAPILGASYSDFKNPMKLVGSLLTTAGPLLIFLRTNFVVPTEALDELSTRQVIFVYVHRRWGLREQAKFVLGKRASTDAAAEAALVRLGHMEPPKTRGPIFTRPS